MKDAGKGTITGTFELVETETLLENLYSVHTQKGTQTQNTLELEIPLINLNNLNLSLNITSQVTRGCGPLLAII